MNFAKVFGQVMPDLIEGFTVTLQVTFLSLLIALFLGLFSCMLGLSNNKILNAINKFYLWIIRGTPILVQAFYIYFAVPQLISGLTGGPFRIPVFTAALITLTLNAGAYMSEIYRSGIQAIDAGQMEAARSLGLPKWRAMIKVIFPQAFKICIPPLVNQFIITLKDSSILIVIGFADIVYQAKIYVGTTAEFFVTYTYVGIFYLVFVTILSWLSKLLERRLSYGEGQEGNN